MFQRRGFKFHSHSTVKRRAARLTSGKEKVSAAIADIQRNADKGEADGPCRIDKVDPSTADAGFSYKRLPIMSCSATY